MAVPIKILEPKSSQPNLSCGAGEMGQLTAGTKVEVFPLPEECGGATIKVRVFMAA